MHNYHVFTLLLTPVGMIMQLHVSQVCAASDEEYYTVWKVLTYMIHMMLYYIKCTIKSGKNKKCVYSVGDFIMLCFSLKFNCYNNYYKY